MSLTTWAAADDFFTGALQAHDPVLEAAQRDGAAAGLPDIAVSPMQGAMLHLLARAMGAARILEIGTLGGYSAIWLGRAARTAGVRGARVVTMEIDAGHARVAQRNIERAGLADIVEVRVGPAVELLAALNEERPAPFDLAFIDADKPSNAEYFAWALRLVRPGGAIIVDNVVRGGAVTDTTSADPAVLGVRRLIEAVAREPRVSASVLQTVGSKGHDGFLLAVINDEARPAV